MGHVLRSPAKKRDRITKNPFKNALEMVRRYRVKGIKNTEVELVVGGKTRVTYTERDGYFEFAYKTTELSCEAQVRLPNFDLTQQVSYVAKNPDKIIVTDIDDTLLVSHSTSLLKKMYLLLTKNYQRRRAFDGIVSLYEDLMGNTGEIFYVSSSEWNLYDFLKDFVNYNGFPNGVFLLQELKSGLRDLLNSGGGSHQHKRKKIDRLLATYPSASFILIGDSGQKDPAIYESVVAEYPHRISKVYIRDVRKSRKMKLRALSERLALEGVAMEILEK